MYPCLLDTFFQKIILQCRWLLGVFFSQIFFFLGVSAAPRCISHFLKLNTIYSGWNIEFFLKDVDNFFARQVALYKIHLIATFIAKFFELVLDLN